MLTVLHAADFHLDSPFRALAPQAAQRRRAAQRETVERLAELAQTCRADLALLAGDLWEDAAQLYPETLEALPRALGRFPCPVVIAPGNHDPYGPDSPYARPIWPENVHIFRSPAVTPLPFPSLGVTVYGCAFTSPFREDDPLAGFTAPRDGNLALGVFHGDVAGAGRYAPIAPESLAHSGLAYAALGHIHTPRLCPDLPTPWAYPGCTQGRGFDELGERGCCLVTLDEHGLQDVAFRPLPGPRYYEQTLDLTGRDPAQAVADALSDLKEDDALRLTLTGETEELDLPALQRLGSGHPGALELRDETARPQDPWARLEEDTLTGHFLREMARRLEEAAPAQRPRLELALRCGLAALEGREEPR